PEQKRHFLKWITLRKTTDFFKDRKMPGIKIRDKAYLTFTKPTEFLGKTYEPGTHEVDISHVFRHVEYGDPSQNPNQLELHFRAKNPAGDVSNSAWTFLSGIQTSRIHQHVHIVSPLNIERLQKEGAVRSAMLADFYRRANLTLEMTLIVEEKLTGIRGRQSGNVVFWDSLNPDRLNSVYRHLENTRVMGKQPNFGSTSKMAFVGFRGADTYDADNLIGFEVRGISQYSNEKMVREFLNTLQWSLDQEHHGIPQEKMAQWLEKQPKGWSFNFGNSYYNQQWEALKTTEAGKKFESIDPFLRNRFYDLENNRELKMMLYDWSNDPLLFDKPKLLELIKKEQLKAVDRLALGQESQHTIVSDFLKHSGLYGIFTRSLGY
ncbi:MAG: hypothetical protein ACKOA8_04945, partial [Deltaproteobacteria bacterium]